MIDENRFIQLYTKILPVIRRFVCAHIPNLTDSEDVLQNISVLLWQKRSDYEPGSSFGAWAMTIARYEILHARRSLARTRILLNEELSQRAMDHFLERDPHLAEEKRQALSVCLDKLPRHSRRLISMFYENSESCTSIAKGLEHTVNQVYTTLHRLRVSLRKCIMSVIKQRGHYETL